MESKALFVEIEASAGKEAEVEQFLRGSLGPVAEERETRDWYAMRFADGHFALFDTFPGNAGRLKHLFGKVGRSLAAKTFTLLDGLPDVEPARIVAEVKPVGDAVPMLCLHVPLKVASGREEAVEHFLAQACKQAEAEIGTLAWYALRFGPFDYAILDFFADGIGRDDHLAGPVARALVERSADLFAEPPEVRQGLVLAGKATIAAEALGA